MTQRQELLDTPEAHGQRAEIAVYLADHVLPRGTSLEDVDSFYRLRPHPEEDPDFLEMFEVAGGDPALYAILVAQDAARSDLEMAQRARGEEGPSAYRVRGLNVELAKENLASMKLLELQYRYPDQYPYEPVVTDA
ncbi:MAG: hypothetical protein JWN82_478 [Candidatus Saccharibacteria bacterium]|nr:hypothetical protein [Candidatus Saccharibacteria bacterium]